MKKLLSTIAITSMLLSSTAAMAHDNHRHGYRGYENRWHDHRRNDNFRRDRNGVSTEGAIAIGLGALIVGAAIANSNNQRRERVQVCEDIVNYDYYGNRYYERRCYTR